jgi:hypothetical protein
MIHFNYGSLSYALTNNIGNLKRSWKDAAKNDLYLEFDFLNSIEELPSIGIKPYYVVETVNDQITKLFYFQIKEFRLRDALKFDQNTFIGKLKSILSKLINYRCLVSGNILVTGNHGSFIKESEIKYFDEQLLPFIVEVQSQIRKHFKDDTSMILVKDFFESKETNRNNQFGYTKAEIDPNMILELAADWTSFDDYLDSLKAKYRVNYRRAIKLLGDVKSIELDLEGLEKYSPVMHELYANIADNANFNLFQLPEKYFVTLKRNLGQLFNVVGFFKNDKMIGFFSYTDNSNHIDAHFLGFDPEDNIKSQLYLNMLYKLTEVAILKRKKTLILSRTAIEIKSSVGAKPFDMVCYFKSKYWLYNQVIQLAFILFKPNTTRKIRHPFK